MAAWMREVRGWGQDVIHVLTEACYVLDNPDMSGDSRNRLCERLSALVDIGRFYLPNQGPMSHGAHKPAAYRGYRHRALDPLVAATRVLNLGLPNGPDEAKVMRELRREFVSALFLILGPEHHNKIIGRIIRTTHTSRSNDKSVGGLTPSDNDIPSGAKALLDQVISRIKLATNTER
ncbi:hypothetical protein [Salinisphaera hydrothermalis]|uniref:hypothetical protein n=1 Tax=Salinisphaera hydrothermalis TaxID=563188 RepID=UPI003340BCBF